MSILVIAEHDNDELKGSTLNTITAAKEIDSDVELLVAGFSCEAVVEKACEIPVISKVVVSDKETYKNFLAENIGALVAQIGSNYSHILTPATSNGKNFMPRVAALLDVAQISEIISVQSEDTFERPIYAGNCIATVKSSDSIKVITVRATGFDDCESEGGSVPRENLDLDTNLDISNFISEELKDPFSARSNNNLSEFSIIFWPLTFKSFCFAVSIVFSDILINSLLTYMSYIIFEYSIACLEDVENFVILTKYSGIFKSSFSFSK